MASTPPSGSRVLYTPAVVTELNKLATDAFVKVAINLLDIEARLKAIEDKMDAHHRAEGEALMALCEQLIKTISRQSTDSSADIIQRGAAMHAATVDILQQVRARIEAKEDEDDEPLSARNSRKRKLPADASAGVRRSQRQAGRS